MAFLKTADLARLFDVRPGTILKWRKRGVIPKGKKMGRDIYWDPREVQKIVLQGKRVRAD